MAMGIPIILGLFCILLGIGSLTCWIMTLIQMFKNEKPLIGILGIFCGLWAFIWGWMNVGKPGMKIVMPIWSVCFALSLAVNSLVFVSAISRARSKAIHVKELNDRQFAMPPSTIPPTGMPFTMPGTPR